MIEDGWVFNFVHEWKNMLIKTLSLFMRYSHFVASFKVPEPGWQLTSPSCSPKFIYPSCPLLSSLPLPFLSLLSPPLHICSLAAPSHSPGCLGTSGRGHTWQQSLLLAWASGLIASRCMHFNFKCCKIGGVQPLWHSGCAGRSPKVETATQSLSSK